MRDVTRLVQQATSQQGLLSIVQARALGIDDKAMARLCRMGLFERFRRGVYRLAGSSPSWSQDLAAVCLSGVPFPVASHRSALRLWNLRSVDDELEATVRRPSTRRIAGAIVHRSGDLELADVTWIDGIPVTNPVRSLCDAGSIFPPREVQRMLDHAVATGLVTVADLWAFRRRVGTNGRNGVGVLGRILEATPVKAGLVESGPELALLRLLSRYDLPEPAVQFPIVVDGARYRVDLAYPEARVAVEYDGFVAHSGRDRFVHDRRRQNAMTLAGWTVLRFTGRDLRDRPSMVAREIRSALSVSRSV